MKMKLEYGKRWKKMHPYNGAIPVIISAAKKSKKNGNKNCHTIRG